MEKKDRDVSRERREERKDKEVSFFGYVGLYDNISYFMII